MKRTNEGCYFPPAIELGYNEKTDLSPVSQSGYLDLCDAFANHCVPADISSDDASYNEVNSPDVGIGKPKDAFELMHYNQSVHDYKPTSSNPSGD